MAKKPIEERFWEKVEKSSDPDGCWNWIAAPATNGYGQFGNGELAHRWAWKFTFGDIPKGLWVLHKCDNRKCCNPAHLFLGTRKDNIEDMIKKGRSIRGERVGSSKLTQEDVVFIRETYAKGNVTQEILAQQFNVSRNAVNLIVRRLIWKHI